MLQRWGRPRCAAACGSLTRNGGLSGGYGPCTVAALIGPRRLLTAAAEFPDINLAGFAVGKHEIDAATPVRRGFQVKLFRQHRHADPIIDRVHARPLWCHFDELVRTVVVHEQVALQTQMVVIIKFHVADKVTAHVGFKPSVFNDMNLLIVPKRV